MYWSNKIKNRISILSFWSILVILFSNLTSCLEPNKVTHFESDLISLSKVVDSFFLDGIQDSVVAVTKSIQVNTNQSETKQLQNYNIQNDLEILKEFDVATPRWAGFVQTNTKDSAGLELITYTMDNTRAPVQRISFVKNGDQLESLRVYGHKKSMVSEQKITINWILGNNYTLKNESHLIFRKQSTFTMNVSY